jgi:hypothetical protein
MRLATTDDIHEILKLIRELAESRRGRDCLWARGMDFRSIWQHLL